MDTSDIERPTEHSHADVNVLGLLRLELVSFGTGSSLQAGAWVRPLA